MKDAEFETLFEFQSDGKSCQMATVPAKTREDYSAHIERIQANPNNIIKIIDNDGTIVGFAVSWLSEEGRVLGYWIGREFWGQGFASQGLALLVQELPERPLIAHVADSNLGSKRVLEKNGFALVSGETINDSNFGQIELLKYQLSASD